MIQKINDIDVVMMNFHNFFMIFNEMISCLHHPTLQQKDVETNPILTLAHCVLHHIDVAGFVSFVNAMSVTFEKSPFSPLHSNKHFTLQGLLWVCQPFSMMAPLVVLLFKASIISETLSWTSQKVQQFSSVGVQKRALSLSMNLLFAWTLHVFHFVLTIALKGGL